MSDLYRYLEISGHSYEWSEMTLTQQLELKANAIAEFNSLRAQLAASQQETRDALAVVASWKRAVEGLTPGGSEFANDPERCAQFIKDRCNYPKQIIELRKQLAAALRTGEREG